MPQRALRLRFDEKAVDSVEQCRAQLAEAKAGMLAAHDARIRPGRLLRAHSDFIDKMLSALWSGLVEDRSLPSRIALIAVGGYGRQELHPGSDIDLLILRARDGSER